MNDDYIIVLTTVSDLKTAEAIADGIIDQKLAACAQVEGPLKSVYRWRGKTEQVEEWKISFKSCQRLYPYLEQEIKKGHPYDTPEIVVTRIMTGSSDYLRWLESELSYDPPAQV